MPSVFLVSDTHFGHAGVCRFTHNDTGIKIRPWTDPAEMDEAMVKMWNDTVRPNDKVYHLGDVVINRKSLQILDRLNGDKVLIRGNHDIFKMEDYTKYFRDIRGYHVMNYREVLLPRPEKSCIVMILILGTSTYLWNKQDLNLFFLKMYYRRLKNKVNQNILTKVLVSLNLNRAISLSVEAFGS